MLLRGLGRGGPAVKIEAGCGLGWLVALCLIFLLLLLLLLPFLDFGALFLWESCGAELLLLQPVDENQWEVGNTLGAGRRAGWVR